MAQITINEISQTYSYNIGNNTYATVALPITACWGPGYIDPRTQMVDDQDEQTAKEIVLESTTWQRFPATQAGLESFVSTYRGPASNYRVVKDYSYQMAMTLLTAGYDVLTCRVTPGSKAGVIIPLGDGELVLNAKWPGTFGNSLQIVIKKTFAAGKFRYWNIIIYIVDGSGTKTSAENLRFVFELANSSDTLLHINEISSNFIEVVSFKGCKDNDDTLVDDKGNAVTMKAFMMTGGDDRMPADVYDAADLAEARFKQAFPTDVTSDYAYPAAVREYLQNVGNDEALVAAYKEWTYNAAIDVFDLLKDKLSYSPNRVMSPWDDQDMLEYNEDFKDNLDNISPMHIKLMDVAYYSRCATGLIDIPRSLARRYVHDENEVGGVPVGYAQKLARYTPPNAVLDINTSLYATHSTLTAPWGQYTYVGTSKQNPAPPSFLLLMIERAMILNQAVQYEWALPTNRKQSLNIGKLDYTVPKSYLDRWQNAQEGVGVNAIAAIPDIGTTVWGNSTLYELPPATYQALANRSTRYLFNAVEDVVYRVGISITFQYNNLQAYNKFYAGCTPILDTMKNVGAIEGYKIQMANDLNSLGAVNANTIVGKIYLLINGVVNDIIVDLVACPPGTDLSAM